jgi:tetratricopeptide (TPR) repeat protein
MKNALTLLLLGAAAGAAHCAPYVPKDDSVVLERLPGRRDDPAMAELRQLRAALAAAPEDPAAATELAQRYFELANAEGDPRYVGYAEAALRAWRGADAPVEVLFTRGLLRQYRHDFDGALEDLQRALERDPEHVAARSWRAAILMVRAEYPAASRECAALAQRASELRATGCSAYVEATTGKTREAYERLSETLRRHPEAGAEAKLWTLTRLAEMAWRLEDHALTDRLFNQAFALGLDDNFLLAAYADYLLERGRAKEVVGLLNAWSRSDTLLLRLALAEHALGMREADAHIQALADRFAAAALRGERLHMGEEARFLLDLKSDPRGSLAVGAENWKSQREPRDALVVLEAAVAARDPKAAAPVLKWLDESGFESTRMQRLALQLKKQQ